MREIKFRAIKDDISDMRFVYGSLVYSPEGVPMIQFYSRMEFNKCIKNTEGQYIGIRDINGKEIYHGDIMDYNQSFKDDDPCPFEVRIGLLAIEKRFIDREEWFSFEEFDLKHCHVTGNIHEKQNK